MSQCINKLVEYDVFSELLLPIVFCANKIELKCLKLTKMKLCLLWLKWLNWLKTTKMTKMTKMIQNKTLFIMNKK